MKAMFKSYKLALSVLALALVLTATIGTSLAYFTTYTWAQGRRPISLGTTTTTEEELDGLNKIISIKNSEDSNNAYVRVKVFSGSGVTVNVSGSDWTKGDGDWWYYNGILAPGESTSKLKAEINNVENPSDFDIVVVHESIQAFDPSISAINADWDQKITVEGGGQ